MKVVGAAANPQRDGRAPPKILAGGVVSREAARLNLHGEAVLEAAFEHVYNAMVITDATSAAPP
jgi:hypothetical protein